MHSTYDHNERLRKKCTEELEKEAASREIVGDDELRRFLKAEAGEPRSREEIAAELAAKEFEVLGSETFAQAAKELARQRGIPLDEAQNMLARRVLDLKPIGFGGEA